MILEYGNRAQFKQCVFENVLTVTCKMGHVIIVPDATSPMDADKLLVISYQNVCCIDALSGQWLDRVQKVMEQMPRSHALDSLMHVLKFTRNLTL